MNLENYGVQEMNAKEISETEGGIWPIVIAVAIFLLATQEAH